MSIKDIWWKLRTRGNSKAALAFTLGMEVGAVVADSQRRQIAARAKDIV